jgi:hypothetical protein
MFHHLPIQRVWWEHWRGCSDSWLWVVIMPYGPISTTWPACLILIQICHSWLLWRGERWRSDHEFTGGQVTMKTWCFRSQLSPSSWRFPLLRADQGWPVSAREVSWMPRGAVFDSRWDWKNLHSGSAPAQTNSTAGSSRRANGNARDQHKPS